MTATGYPSVKICGLTRRADVELADSEAVDYLGIVLSSGFSRSIGLNEARLLMSATRARRVAVLVDEDVEAAVRRAETIEAAVVQLHGDEPASAVEELRARGGWRIWKAVRARTPDDVAAAIARYDGLIDALLVEGAREGVIGGGGVRLELSPGAARAALAGTRFVLAGGLGPENVGTMVARFLPDVVDVSSGIEGEVGQKDATRLRAFVRAVRSSAPGASRVGDPREGPA